jgi:hypothetical protein
MFSFLIKMLLEVLRVLLAFLIAGGFLYLGIYFVPQPSVEDPSVQDIAVVLPTPPPVFYRVVRIALCLVTAYTVYWLCEFLITLVLAIASLIFIAFLARTWDDLTSVHYNNLRWRRRIKKSHQECQGEKRALKVILAKHQDKMEDLKAELGRTEQQLERAVHEMKMRPVITSVNTKIGRRAREYIHSNPRLFTPVFEKTFHI